MKITLTSTNTFGRSKLQTAHCRSVDFSSNITAAQYHSVTKDKSSVIVGNRPGPGRADAGSSPFPYRGHLVQVTSLLHGDPEGSRISVALRLSSVPICRSLCLRFGVTGRLEGGEIAAAVERASSRSPPTSAVSLDVRGGHHAPPSWGENDHADFPDDVLDRDRAAVLVVLVVPGVP